MSRSTGVCRCARRAFTAADRAAADSFYAAALAVGAEVR